MTLSLSYSDSLVVGTQEVIHELSVRSLPRSRLKALLSEDSGQAVCLLAPPLEHEPVVSGLKFLKHYFSSS